MPITSVTSDGRYDGLPQIDVTEPEHGVGVEIDETRHVLYVHVDGITVLRICRIPGRVDVTIKTDLAPGDYSAQSQDVPD